MTGAAVVNPFSTLPDPAERKEIAESLAAVGFHLFPCISNGKPPAVEGWQALATRETAKINRWIDEGYNLGINAGRFDDGTDQALLVIDLDVKGDKDGIAAWEKIVVQHGGVLPATYTQRSPSGGRHIVFRLDSERAKHIANSVGGREHGGIAPGIDVRTTGGLIVAAGSVRDDAAWEVEGDIIAPAPAPEWLVALAPKKSEAPVLKTAPSHIDATLAEEDARRILDEHQPPLREGDGSDDKTYKLVARCKDTGASEDQILAIMLEPDGWNSRNLPRPFDEWWLRKKIRNVFKHGQNDPGSNAVSFAEFGTGAFLFQQPETPMRWIIDTVLPEGLTLLFTRPKIGKSLLGLDYAVACLTGKPALDKFPVEQCDVLLLALEDNDRRMRNRLRARGFDKFPLEAQTRLHYRLTWKRLDEGGLDDLREFLDTHPAVRYILIDTLEYIRRHRHRNEDPYSADVEALAPLRELANERHIAIVVIHHDRKQEVPGGDWIDSASGTLGLTGTADTLQRITRTRQKHVAKLSITGRDVDEAEIDITLDDFWVWHARDGGADNAASRDDSAARDSAIVAAVFAGHDTREKVAEHVGLSINYVGGCLAQLAVDGVVVKRKVGKELLYSIPVCANDVFAV